MTEIDYNKLFKNHDLSKEEQKRTRQIIEEEMLNGKPGYNIFTTAINFLKRIFSGVKALFNNIKDSGFHGFGDKLSKAFTRANDIGDVSNIDQITMRIAMRLSHEPSEKLRAASKDLSGQGEINNAADAYATVTAPNSVYAQLRDPLPLPPGTVTNLGAVCYDGEHSNNTGQFSPGNTPAQNNPSLTQGRPLS